MPLVLYRNQNSVIQVKTTFYEGVATATGGVPTIITNGLQLFSLTFTPLSASSTILVQTSSVAISEEANAGDQSWLALWYGTTFVCANGGSALYSHYAGSLNVGEKSLCHAFPSWGTSAQQLQVRAGMSSGTSYINGGSTYNYTGSSQRVSMAVMEISNP